ncbi:hypothetical protein ACTPEW_16150 [Clostridioides difficile]
MKEELRKEVNIIPFLAESLSSNKKCYKFIDKYYNENKLKYLNLARESIFYNSSVAKQGSIIQEYYFKKALGILLSEENDIIINILESGYKGAYKYVDSIQIFKLSSFVKKLMLKNKIEFFSSDELNSNILVAISLCGGLAKKVDEKDYVYINFINSLSFEGERDKQGKKISIENLSKNEQKLLSKIELKLKSKYLKEYIPSFYSVKFDGTRETIILDNLTSLDKQLLPFDYIYDLEDVSPVFIVGKDIFKSKEIQELILCYYHLQNNIKDEDSIDYEDLFRFIIPAIDLRYWVREYKKAKQFFFDNFNEELEESLKEKEIEINDLKKDNLLLQEENEKLKLELELLQKDKVKLKNQVKEQHTFKEELVQLRSFMFKQQQNQDEKVVIDESIDLKNIKAIIFGGHPNWILKMRKVLNNFEFISVDTINFDVSILKSYEYVFINTSYIGHAMYYKIIENLNKNNKLRYINNVNVNRVKKDIKNAIMI